MKRNLNQKKTAISSLVQGIGRDRALNFTDTRVANIFAFIAIALPLSPLFLLGKGFFFDWHNHLWMIGYTGEYFRQHWSFPTTFAALPGVGYSLPLFYATWFYPIAGFFSAFLGASLALRLILFCVYGLQFFSVKKLFEKVAPSYFASGVACISLWAIYPMTLLYNRAALPEFFATSILMSVTALLAREEEFNWITVLVLSLLLAAAFGSHPITAFYGSLAIMAVLLPRWREWRFILLLGVLVAVFLSPWIVVMQTFRNSMVVSHTTRHIFFDSDLNSWWLRFIPFAYDPRVVLKGVNVDTPYLDAQINFPLFLCFLLCLAFVVRQQKTLKPFLKTSYYLVCAFVALSFSADPLPWEYVKETAKVVQFPYRLITYVNLFLLLALYYSVKNAFTEKIRLVVLLCGFLALGTVLHKLPRALQVLKVEEKNVQWRGERDSLLMPLETLPLKDYSTVKLYRPKESLSANLPLYHAVFSVGRAKQFGSIEPIAFDLEEDVFVQTNVALFPWNKIYVNGDAVEADALFYNQETWMGFKLGRGHYKVEYSFEPPLWWKVLRALSFSLLMIGLSFLIVRFLKNRLSIGQE